MAPAKAHARRPMLFTWLAMGSLANALLLIWTFQAATATVPPSVLWPARIFFAVSSFRCAFPNRYNGNVVLRDTWLSSILLTRALATAAEVSWIYQLAYVARMLNVADADLWLVDALGVSMVAACVIAQVCVWVSVLSCTAALMFWEEVGWFAIFLFNTILNWRAPPSSALAHAAWISLAFAVPYLPFQLFLHLPALSVHRRRELDSGKRPTPTWAGLRRAAFERHATVEWARWGGNVTALWMFSYWTLIPLWHVYMVHSFMAA